MIYKLSLFLVLFCTFALNNAYASPRHPNEMSEAEIRAINEELEAEKKKQEAKPVTAEITAQAELPERQPVKRNTNLGTCTELGQHIESCKPYKCRMPHPQANTFEIDHEVIGFVTDDLLCNHTQTIPGNGIIDCRYPRDMRKAIAKQFNGTDDIAPEDAHIVSRYFELFCEVIQ